MPLLPKSIREELLMVVFQFFFRCNADTVSLGSTWASDIACLSDVGTYMTDEEAETQEETEERLKRRRCGNRD